MGGHCVAYLYPGIRILAGITASQQEKDTAMGNTCLFPKQQSIGVLNWFKERDSVTRLTGD